MTVMFVLFHRTTTFTTKTLGCGGVTRVCATEEKNMTFLQKSTDKIVTVWRRGRLNALHWAIKATRPKVKDNLFCTRRVKNKKQYKKKTITRKHTTEPP